jgi:hypothetical protein
MTPALDLHPGSDLSRAAGCRCDPLANAFGCGRQHAWGVSFIIVQHCPLHGFKLEVKPWINKPPSSSVSFNQDGKINGQ